MFVIQTATLRQRKRSWRAAYPKLDPFGLIPPRQRVPQGSGGTIEEQTAIAAILSDMDSEIVSLETALAKARHLKRGMMQELLTARIRLV